MADSSPYPVAKLELFNENGGRSATVKLYSDGEIMLKNENGDIIILSVEQQRILRRMLPE